MLPSDWTPAADMRRVICHWTAGAHTASDFDKQHYHLLIESGPRVVRGTPSIVLNQSPVRLGYAAHTRNCNGGSVGVSLCCMAGARESPFDAGAYPMTREQWGALVQVVADLCLVYDIAVSRTTVLSHAEVQGNLGIAQAGKWDFTRLAFDPAVVGALACGDKLRAEVAALLTPAPKVEPAPLPAEPINAPQPEDSETGVVTADVLNFRRAPDGEITGSLPRGVVLSIIGRSGAWLNVVTPAGYTGWVHGDYVKVLEEGR
jgi:hypothetical protein